MKPQTLYDMLTTKMNAASIVAIGCTILNCSYSQLKERYTCAVSTSITVMGIVQYLTEQHNARGDYQDLTVADLIM